MKSRKRYPFVFAFSMVGVMAGSIFPAMTPPDHERKGGWRHARAAAFVSACSPSFIAAPVASAFLQRLPALVPGQERGT